MYTNSHKWFLRFRLKIGHSSSIFIVNISCTRPWRNKGWRRPSFCPWEVAVCSRVEDWSVCLVASSRNHSSYPFIFLRRSLSRLWNHENSRTLKLELREITFAKVMLSSSLIKSVLVEKLKHWTPLQWSAAAVTSTATITGQQMISELSLWLSMNSSSQKP
jgi:hypothetical protein